MKITADIIIVGITAIKDTGREKCVIMSDITIFGSITGRVIDNMVINITTVLEIIAKLTVILITGTDNYLTSIETAMF